MLGYAVHHYCPLDYCNSGVVHFDFTEINKQCVHNRAGLLCGECKANYSLMLGSAHCGKCEDYNLYLLTIFALAGIALVVLILLLRLTVAEGTINGLILYANIFYIRRNQFLPTTDCIFLRVFLAWLNLDFGIETCLYDGLNMYIITWLQFLFPLYIWTLVGVVTFCSSRSSWMTRMLGTNPVAVFATLLLLSYNKLMQTIITVFSICQLSYTNASDTVSEFVWLYDANISFLETKYIVLFVTSLFVLLFLLVPYTLLLLFGQCVQSNSNRILFSWVNRPLFKYFLDNYHAPYQNRHRYWTGVMLLVRVVLLIGFAGDVTNDPNVYMLITIAVLVCMESRVWIVGTTGIYKKCGIDVLNASFMLNLLLSSAAVSFCQSGSVPYEQQQRTQSVVGYCSLEVTFLVFLGILCYHIHLQLKSTSLCKKIKLCKRSDGEGLELIQSSREQ